MSICEELGKINFTIIKFLKSISYVFSEGCLLRVYSEGILWAKIQIVYQEHTQKAFKVLKQML